MLSHSAEIDAGSWPSSLTVSFLWTVIPQNIAVHLSQDQTRETPPTQPHGVWHLIVSLDLEVLCWQFVEFNWWECEEGRKRNTHTHTHTHTLHSSSAPRLHLPENELNVLSQHQLKPFRHCWRIFYAVLLEHLLVKVMDSIKLQARLWYRVLMLSGPGELSSGDEALPSYSPWEEAAFRACLPAWIWLRSDFKSHFWFSSFKKLSCPRPPFSPQWFLSASPTNSED